LKDPKHKPVHVLEGKTNFADIALGNSLKKIKTMKNAEE